MYGVKPDGCLHVWALNQIPWIMGTDPWSALRPPRVSARLTGGSQGFAQGDSSTKWTAVCGENCGHLRAQTLRIVTERKGVQRRQRTPWKKTATSYMRQRRRVRRAVGTDRRRP